MKTFDSNKEAGLGGLTLGELIKQLERYPLEQRVDRGFCRPHSYRGDYYELSFEPCLDTTVGEMLDAARSALGQTMSGWKGGDYTMDEHSSCWLSCEGESGGEVIGRWLLVALLGAPPDAQAGIAK